ncbi:MAG: hypothetical protein HC898_12665 [Phycisphaerales bacterium]|nr:hypothetical protein [Phycisphaerales bacterium]
MPSDSREQAGTTGDSSISACEPASRTVMTGMQTHRLPQDSGAQSAGAFTGDGDASDNAAASETGSVGQQTADAFIK